MNGLRDEGVRSDRGGAAEDDAERVASGSGEDSESRLAPARKASGTESEQVSLGLPIRSMMMGGRPAAITAAGGTGSA
jgi:hypothetical protein